MTSGSTAQQNDDDLPEIYACAQCKRTYSNKSHLVRHVKAHSGEKTQKCSECGKTFTYKWDLVNHMRSHTKQRPFQCDDCGKTFSDRSVFGKHKACHSGIKRFLCEFCGMQFTQSAGLLRHRKWLHICDEECEVCKAKFSSKSEWRRHMDAHESHRPLICPHCPRRFHNPQMHYRHLRVHSGRKLYPCDACEKVFVTPSALDNHNAVRHVIISERPKFVCSKCNKSFLAQQSLRDHSCIDNFRCWICRKKFISKGEMEIHKKKHPEEEIRKHVCSHCGKRFRKPHLLKGHDCKATDLSTQSSIQKRKALTDVVPVFLTGKRRKIHIVKDDGVKGIKMLKKGLWYCNVCWKMFGGKCLQEVSHECIDPQIRKELDFRLESERVPISYTSSGEEVRGEKFEASSAKPKESIPDVSVRPHIIEIKQECDENRLSSQETTYVFKIEGSCISVMRP